MTLFSIQGDLRPDSALSSLTIFEGKFTRLREERDNVIKAKEALELVDQGAAFLDTHFHFASFFLSSLSLLVSVHQV